MTRLLTVFECADRLSLAPATIRKMLNRGELTAIYPTQRRGAVRIREDEIKALIAREGLSSSGESEVRFDR